MYMYMFSNYLSTQNFGFLLFHQFKLTQMEGVIVGSIISLYVIWLVASNPKFLFSLGGALAPFKNILVP